MSDRSISTFPELSFNFKGGATIVFKPDDYLLLNGFDVSCSLGMNMTFFDKSFEFTRSDSSVYFIVG